MSKFVPESAIDYDEVCRRAGHNHGDEDSALFKCPNSLHGRFGVFPPLRLYCVHSARLRVGNGALSLGDKMKETIPVKDVLQYEPYGFTNCVLYRDTLYLSGVSGLNMDGSLAGGDIESQTFKTYENIAAILQAAGSGLDQVLQMTSFIVDLEHNGPIYVSTRKKILSFTSYTSATIGVVALMIPGLLLEVQCVAAIPR